MDFEDELNIEAEMMMEAQYEPDEEMVIDDEEVVLLNTEIETTQEVNAKIEPHCAKSELNNFQKTSLSSVELAEILRREFGSQGTVGQMHEFIEKETFGDFVTKPFKFRSVIDSNLLQRPPESGGFVHITLSNGERKYIPERSRQMIDDTTLCEMSGLMKKSMDDLAKEAKDIELQCHLRKAHTEKNASLGSRESMKGLEGYEDLLRDLWVQKYAPHSFVQLLSPEKINREVLKSLKRWDRFVFKKTSASAADNTDPKAKANYDEDGRPRNKVMLLCGPPGTGKTTLAHVVASHCGYRTLEINASDDRSPEVIRDLMQRAIQNNTLDRDKRPNCVILDEVDGMDATQKTAIEQLVAIIKAPLTYGKNGKKGDSGVFALTRPLIFICNDQYAPVLREIRKLAEIFVFQAPGEMRLVQRLKAICETERLSLNSSRILSDLCGATGCDIRSSINTLQFAALKSVKQLSGVQGAARSDVNITNALQSMIDAGLKDDNLDVAQVWRYIFMQKAAQNRTITDAQILQYSESARAAGMQRQRLGGCLHAMEMMTEYGDFPQVIGGIHENYLLSRKFDPLLHRHGQCADWLSLVDTMHQFTLTSPDGFQVHNYIPMVSGVVHKNLAVTERVSIQWPKKDREMYYRRMQRLNILQTFMETSENALSGRTRESVVLDLVTYLMDVISVRVRPRLMITLSPAEKQLLTGTLSVMSAYGLSYVYQKVMMDAGNTFVSRKFQKPSGPAGKGKQSEGDGVPAGADRGSTLVLQLEPAIDQLLEFAGQSGRHAKVSEELKQLIYSELKKFLLRKKEEEVPADRPVTTEPEVKHATPSKAKPAAASSPAQTESAQKKAKVSANMGAFLLLQKTESLEGSAASKPTATFAMFGGQKRSASGAAAGSDEQPNKKTSGVHFKFNQGFSNAVRRRVTIADFL